MFEGADAFLLYRMGWRALRFMYRLVWRGVRWIGRSAMRLARFVSRSYDSLLSVATRGCKQAGIAGTLPPCAGIHGRRATALMRAATAVLYQATSR